ncbi:hypothetical protein PhCBS80983_g06225 [Powellomyces hirtus]|uniref:PhoD-like phosphatase domain-containing protein n=1 Tax=Powellomyces hirtus TaxID=109895 RepID=A0A507DPP3_9FUNG|nr:hypothetical protein PhCBS80983_g06225 [Powellomyces hirtus]
MARGEYSYDRDRDDDKKLDKKWKKKGNRSGSDDDSGDDDNGSDHRNKDRKDKKHSDDEDNDHRQKNQKDRRYKKKNDDDSDNDSNDDERGHRQHKKQDDRPRYEDNLVGGMARASVNDGEERDQRSQPYGSYNRDDSRTTQGAGDYGRQRFDQPEPSRLSQRYDQSDVHVQGQYSNQPDRYQQSQMHETPSRLQEQRYEQTDVYRPTYTQPEAYGDARPYAKQRPTGSERYGVEEQQPYIIPAQGYGGPAHAQQPAHAAFAAPFNFVGPLLRFHDINTDRREWTGSVLIVARERPSQTPVCAYGDGHSQPQNAPVTELTTFGDNVFYRFDLVVPMTQGTDKAITYIINGGHRYTFYVPPLGVDCRVMGMSCNGFSSDVTDPEAEGGITPLWKDVMRRHKENPFHVMLGGGDQLYMDPIFTSNDHILKWLQIEGRDAKAMHPFDDEIRDSVEKFCFNNYVRSFGEDVMKDAFATIPYAFLWDDHDIFDGYGSYPKWLADCPIFHGIYATTRNFYLLFQQHTTDANRPRERDYIIGAGASYSFIKHLGPSVAVLGLDTRSERNLDQVVSPETWRQAFDALQTRVRPTVKHLVVMVAIPVVWPRLKAADAAVGGLGNFLAFATGKLSAFSAIPVPGMFPGIGEAIGKSGLYKSIMGVFGEPELADDLTDHWTNERHEVERTTMIQRFQSFAQARNIRVTFLSGDVHCCGVGWLRSKTTSAADIRTDPRTMYQIVSSAIINVPPPGMVIGMLHRNSGEVEVDANTVDEMITGVFSEDVDGKVLEDGANKILGRRNWCSFEFDQRAGDLNWTIWVERVDRSVDAKGYGVKVAPLSK